MSEPGHWIRILGVRSAAIAALLLTTLAVLAPATATPPTALSLSQQSITVEPGASTTLIVMAGGASPGDRLAFHGDAGISATVRASGPHYWIVMVGADPALISEGLLTVQLLSRTGSNLGFAQAKVVVKAQPAADAMVKAGVTLDGDLVDGHELQAFVTISSLSEQALSIHQLSAVAPAGVQFHFGKAPGLILPRQTLIIPFTIAVGPRAASAPGKHVAGIKIPITSDLTPEEAHCAGALVGRRGWNGNIVASTDLTLSVPGMSALEGVLQIPSLLLLPGLLVVITFSAILNLAKPRPPGEDPLTRLSVMLSPGLWVVMTMISGLIGLGYRLLSGRNILYAYGLRDVTWLWFVSIAIGGFAGAVAFWLERRRQAAAAAPRFAPDIGPVDLLRHLAADGKSLRMASTQAGDFRLFNLEPGPDDAQVWACGAIAYRFPGQRDEALITAFRAAAASDDVARVAELATGPGVTLAWRAFDNGRVRVTAPRLVSRDLFKEPILPDTLVQEAV